MTNYAAPGRNISPLLACMICGNVENNTEFIVREMMFGLRDEFRYSECANCNCIYRLDTPASMQPYYPESYGAHTIQEQKPQSIRERWARKSLAKYLLNGKGVWGKRLLLKHGRPRSPGFGSPDYLGLLSRCGADFNSVIVDVGCGAGSLLQMMQRDGFSSLYGVEPNIDSNRILEGGVMILSDDLTAIDFPCDVIMFHHSFEHVDQPKETLAKVVDLLRPGGSCLIRMPVAGTFAWRNYRHNWAQLDAPRHVCIQSVKSMKLLALKVGLTLVDVQFDSTAFQFLASEQYSKDIPYRSENSFLNSLDKSPFSKKEIGDFRRRAKELNSKNDGDMACFFLKKELK